MVADDLLQPHVETPVELVKLRMVVGGELAASARWLTPLILAVGLIVVVATMPHCASSVRRCAGRRAGRHH